jgi:hypothetical protein
MAYRPSRFALRLSNALFLLAVVLLGLWVQSFVRGATVTRRTTVISGNVIAATDPKERVTEYMSHTRFLSSHVGRVYAGYMRAEELNKSKDLPRRVTYHFNWSWSRGHDRFKAPQLAARLGLDWDIGEVREGGRPNGEYWSNRDIFLCVPYWMLVLPTAALAWLVGRRSRLVRRRLRRGLCPACGYDLSATPQRCPECGLTPDTPEVARAT